MEDLTILFRAKLQAHGTVFAITHFVVENRSRALQRILALSAPLGVETQNFFSALMISLMR